MISTPRERADVLAQADHALAAATEHYLTLSEPRWKLAGSTRTTTATDPDTRLRRSRGGAPPLPINLDVLDYLELVEAEVLGLAGEIVGRLGGYADQVDEWRGAITQLPTATVAFQVLRDTLPNLPNEVAGEVAAAAWRLDRSGAKLLGRDERTPTRQLCGWCGRLSVIADPTDPTRSACVAGCHRDPSPARE